MVESLVLSSLLSFDGDMICIPVGAQANFTFLDLTGAPS